MRVLLDEFLNHLAIERGLSPLTVSAYRRDLAGLIAFLERRGLRSLDDATRDMIGEHLMAEKARGLSGSSLARFLAALKVFFRFLASNRYVRADITDVLEGPRTWRRIPDVMSVKEVERFLSAPRAVTDLGRRDRALLEVMYATGARVSEAAGLKVEDDPAAGVDALRKAAPDLDRRFATRSVAATLPVLFPEEAGRPFGFQNLAQWQDYADWMRRNDLLTRPVDVGTVATNEFLPGEGLGNAAGEPKAP